MNNLQTPLERLISDKERIQQQCSIHGQKINEDISYIQKHAGSLLLSGLSSLLFPGSKQTTQASKGGDSPPHPTGLAPTPLGLTEYFSIAKGMIPVAWELAQPFIVSWGVKKAKKWFVNLFTKKKK